MLFEFKLSERNHKMKLDVAHKKVKDKNENRELDCQDFDRGSKLPSEWSFILLSNVVANVLFETIDIVGK